MWNTHNLKRKKNKTKTYGEYDVKTNKNIRRKHQMFTQVISGWWNGRWFNIFLYTFYSFQTHHDHVFIRKISINSKNVKKNSNSVFCQNHNCSSWSFRTGYSNWGLWTKDLDSHFRYRISASCYYYVGIWILSRYPDNRYMH